MNAKPGQRRRIGPSAKRAGWWHVATRRVAMAVIAVGIGLLGSALSRAGHDAPLWNTDSAPAADIQSAIASVFAGRSCVTGAQAEEGIGPRLLELGYRDWSVVSGPGVRGDGCVSSTTDTVRKRVVLIMALRPEVKEALAVVAARLLDECLTKEQAREAVAAALREVGELGWELREDGPIGGPVNRLDDIKQHVAKGCFIYSGTGWGPDGQRLYFIAGR
jgi:hypothetical protein